MGNDYKLRVIEYTALGGACILFVFAFSSVVLVLSVVLAIVGGFTFMILAAWVLAVRENKVMRAFKETLCDDCKAKFEKYYYGDSRQVP